MPKVCGNSHEVYQRTITVLLLCFYFKWAVKLQEEEGLEEFHLVIEHVDTVFLHTMHHKM